MSFDVFISYASKDKVIADATCAALEVAHVRCWIAPRDILPGADWSASIIEALDHCRAMVLIFSAKANDSPQIRNEVARAVQRGVPVIPVRIEDIPPTKSLAYFIGAVHWLDALTPPIEGHLKRLAENVKAMLELASASGHPASNGSPQGSRVEAMSTHEQATSTIPKAPGQSKPAMWRRNSFAAMAALCVIIVTAFATLTYFPSYFGRWFSANTPPVVSASSSPPESVSTPLYEQMLARYAITAPGVARDVRERNARDYEREKAHKAQAVSLSPPGLWRSSARQSAEIAEEAALENCQVFHGNPCTLVAVNETLRPIPPNGEWPRRDMPRVRYAGNFDPNQLPGLTHLRDRSDVAGYASKPGPKVVVLGPSSRLVIETSASSQREAEEQALNSCNNDLSRNGIVGQCFLYAVGNQVVLPQRLKKPMS